MRTALAALIPTSCFLSWFVSVCWTLLQVGPPSRRHSRCSLSLEHRSLATTDNLLFSFTNQVTVANVTTQRSSFKHRREPATDDRTIAGSWIVHQDIVSESQTSVPVFVHRNVRASERFQFARLKPTLMRTPFLCF